MVRSTNDATNARYGRRRQGNGFYGVRWAACLDLHVQLYDYVSILDLVDIVDDANDEPSEHTQRVRL